MERNERRFEVIYTALDQPADLVERAILVARAITAMVDSRLVRRAEAPVFLARAEGGAAFKVWASSSEALSALPQSYGSAIGHFGLFERGSMSQVG